MERYRRQGRYFHSGFWIRRYNFWCCIWLPRLRQIHLGGEKRLSISSRIQTSRQLGHRQRTNSVEALSNRRIAMKVEYTHETLRAAAKHMPAVYSACFRVLKEVRRRLPGFSPSKVLDFGAGPGLALWAMRDVWPKSLKHVNLVEPSKEMQRAAQSLLADLKELPVIHSYDSIQALNRELYKHERAHDLVISTKEWVKEQDFNSVIPKVEHLIHTHFFTSRLPFSVAAMTKKKTKSEHDVVIVGGGIIGLSFARHLLLNSDLFVVVIDASVPCCGATGADKDISGWCI